MAEAIRPPHVSFETRPIEDRKASLAAGCYMTKDVDFIIIIPHGSEGRTVIEQDYSEWLAKMKPLAGINIMAAGGGSDTPAVAESRFPKEWIVGIEAGYKAFKEGMEIPIEGTSILNWPVMPPALRKNCVAIHIRTVEEFADCSSEALDRVGLNAPVYQQRAKDYLKAKSENPAKIAAEMEELRAAKAAAEARIKGLEKRLQNFETKQQDQKAIA